MIGQTRRSVPLVKDNLILRGRKKSYPMIRWNCFTITEDSATLGSDTSAGMGLRKAVHQALPFSLPSGNKCDKPTCQVSELYRGSG